MSDDLFDELFEDLDDIEVESDMDIEEKTKDMELKKVDTAPLEAYKKGMASVKDAFRLVEEADRLFDFSDTDLNPMQQAYIIGYCVKGTKVGACTLAGVSYSTVKNWLDSSREFKKRLEMTTEMVGDLLEAELIRRAMDGSDKLLLEAIKAHKAEKYAPKKRTEVDVNGSMVHSWADLAKEAAIDVDYEEVDDD